MNIVYQHNLPQSRSSIRLGARKKFCKGRRTPKEPPPLPIRTKKRPSIKNSKKALHPSTGEKSDHITKKKWWVSRRGEGASDCPTLPGSANFRQHAPI